jgi:hypothetical protein
VIRLRADSRINAIIEEVATGGEAGVYYLDSAKHFRGGLTGSETLLEHVHFDSQGNTRLARFVSDQTANIISGDTGVAAGAMTLSDAEISRLAFDIPAFRVRGLRRLLTVVSGLPFTLRNRNDQLIERLAARIDSLESERFVITDAMMAYLIANPDDFGAHEKLVEYILARARASHSAGNRERTDKFLNFAEGLVGIRGRARSLNLQRESWAREFAELREAPQPR